MNVIEVDPILVLLPEIRATYARLEKAMAEYNYWEKNVMPQSRPHSHEEWMAHPVNVAFQDSIDAHHRAVEQLTGVPASTRQGAIAKFEALATILEDTRHVALVRSIVADFKRLMHDA